MNRTKIEWAKNPDGTQGYTWNPITGCLNGCSYCYARKLANGRLRSRYLANDNISKEAPYSDPGQFPFLDPFYPRFWPERLLDLNPYKFKHPQEPRGIFVCDMGELFGDWIPYRWQQEVFEVFHEWPEHHFYLLTKQPQNLIKWSPFPDNCWVGVSATDHISFSNALHYLMMLEAKVKYISFEPLLSRVFLDADMIKVADWVIIGAQTKPYKPPKIEWVREIIEACDKAGIPVFIKRNMNSENLPDNAFNREGLVRQEMPEGR